MLKRLHLKNFTVFADADFEFSEGLNVLVGTNGTGKSHVLKLGYAVEKVLTSTLRNSESDVLNGENLFGVIALGSQLSNIFLPGSENRLVRNIHNINDAHIKADFGDLIMDFSIKFSNQPLNYVGPLNFNTSSSFKKKYNIYPVFIPAKEIISLMPDIIGISAQFNGVFDGTYTDLAQQLTIRIPAEVPDFIKPILNRWSGIMKGTIISEDGRFYFQPANTAKFRVGLAAEGFRKLGTLAHLLANGSLTKESTLFWDEPESNLNPALLRELAKALAELAHQGFQIILATHSTDLLKEFHILSRQKNAKDFKIKYFGLNAGPGEAVRIVTTDNFEYLPDVVALEVELEQADELNIIFAREDRERNADYNRAE